MPEHVFIILLGVGLVCLFTIPGRKKLPMDFDEVTNLFHKEHRRSLDRRQYTYTNVFPQRISNKDRRIWQPVQMETPSTSSVVLNQNAVPIIDKPSKTPI
jgi:hypothetical protein